MENIRNKTNNIYPKDYFDRFTMLSVSSFTKPNDKKYTSNQNLMKFTLCSTETLLQSRKKSALKKKSLMMS